MKIKALVSFACKEVSATPGQEYTCSDAIAEDLIRAGYAAAVEESAAAAPKVKRTRKKKAVTEE